MKASEMNHTAMTDREMTDREMNETTLSGAANTAAVVNPRPRPVAAGRTASPTAALAAALAMAIALSGCAGSHVGDAWQCPMAQGEACADVAAVDPAVSGHAVPVNPAAGKIPYRGRSAQALQWDKAARAGSSAQIEWPGSSAETDRAGSPAGTEWAGPPSRCTGGCRPLAWIAGLFRADGDRISKRNGAGPAPDQSLEPMLPVTAEAGWRTPETIGRIWIAPFADGAGLFHEGRWVRVVIEPAGWRLK